MYIPIIREWGNDSNGPKGGNNDSVFKKCLGRSVMSGVMPENMLREDSLGIDQRATNIEASNCEVGRSFCDEQS
jgi:hypothetical protein